MSLPLLVAFTTLQTRLFFPVGSLLGVGVDVQTSLALFDRIFEYLDQPIDIAEKPDAQPVATAGDVAFERVWFRYDADWTLKDVTFTVPAGIDDGPRWRDRVRARRRWGTSLRGSMRSAAGGSRSTASTSAI